MFINTYVIDLFGCESRITRDSQQLISSAIKCFKGLEIDSAKPSNPAHTKNKPNVTYVEMAQSLGLPCGCPVFDTDLLSILQVQTGAEYKALIGRIGMHEPEDFAVSIISFHEQVIGCHSYINRAKKQSELIKSYERLSKALACFSSMPVVPFDDRAFRVLADLISKKIRIGTMDLRIASVTISRGAILLTRNAIDYEKVPGLNFENWLI